MLNEQNELLNQIRLGEDSVLKFKTVNIQGKKILEPHHNSLADELAAMANTCDGICILGVDPYTKSPPPPPPPEGCLAVLLAGPCSVELLRGKTMGGTRHCFLSG